MRIEDRFTVALPLAEAWEVLRDVERIAPCLPGAQLTEIEGDEYRGVVKVKLGAITAQYKGSVHFAEIDEAAHRMVLSAKGRETRGQGNASAEVVVTLIETDAGTEVAIDTDLSISGKIAQFGRGVLADVSSKLLGEFARCLEDDLAGSAGGSALVGEAGAADSVVDDEGADPGMDLGAGAGVETTGVAMTGVETTATATSGYETSVGGDAEPAEAEPADAEREEGTPLPADAEQPDAEEAGKPLPADAGPGANGSNAALAGASAPEPPARPALRAVPSPPSEPLDLLALAGPTMVARALPIALVADLALLAVVRRPFARWLLSAVGLGLAAAVVGAQHDR